MKKIYAFRWPDEFGPEWLNIDNLRSVLFSAVSISPDFVEVEDIATPQKEETGVLNEVVIGALAEFAEYIHKQTGHRQRPMYTLVDMFVKSKGIKHTDGLYNWHERCVKREEGR